MTTMEATTMKATKNAIVRVKGSGVGTVVIWVDGRVWFYLTRLPKPGQMPREMVLVHNPVWPPARIPGVRGSRWWFELPNKRLKACTCGIGGRHFCYMKTPSKAQLQENARRIRRRRPSKAAR